MQSFHNLDGKHFPAPGFSFALSLSAGLFHILFSAAQKRAAVQTAQRLSEPIGRLFCVLDGTALADDIDLDLTGIIEGVLDLLGDLAG